MEGSLIEQLVRYRAEECFPPGVLDLARSIARRSLALLYPHFAENRVCTSRQIGQELSQLDYELDEFAIRTRQPKGEFVEALPAIRGRLDLDAKAILDGDPAARSLDEVLLAYPGFLAIAVYRIAHFARTEGWTLLPRLLSEWAHERTGIDIHPGATIGARFCIDHGTGLVIGETTEIGDDVKLYQGVTLGAVAVKKELADAKRHPTIGNGVVVYANATILGGSTRIGDRTIVGGSAWVTRSVPPDSLVDGNGRVRPLVDRETPLDYVI